MTRIPTSEREASHHVFPCGDVLTLTFTPAIAKSGDAQDYKHWEDHAAAKRKALAIMSRAFRDDTTVILPVESREAHELDDGQHVNTQAAVMTPKKPRIATTMSTAPSSAYTIAFTSVRGGRELTPAFPGWRQQWHRLQ